VRKQAVLAVLDLIRAAYLKIPAAVFAERIERAVAEKAVERLAVFRFVAGKVLAIAVAKESEAVLHGYGRLSNRVCEK